MWLSTACSLETASSCIETTDDSDIKDRLYIHLIFFIVTGCLGDPARAIEFTESFVSDQMLSTLGTVETTVTSFFSTTARPTGDVRLGLLRVVGNSARPPLRPLTTDPVGSISVADWRRERHTDVDSDVSRQHPAHLVPRRTLACAGPRLHQRIVFVSGVDRCRQPIELPRRDRPANFANTPVEIHNGDTLCLGATTRFLVIRITD